MNPRLLATASFLVLTCIGAAAAAQEANVTVEELLALADEHAAVLDEHDAKLEIAKWQRYRAKYAWTPKFKSDALVAPVPANADPWHFGENLDEIGELDLGPFVTQTLNVVVPVYTFGRISIARDLADLGIDRAKFEREQAHRDMEYQVRRAYYSLQLSNSFDALLSEGGGLIKGKVAEMEEAREFGEGDFDIQDLRKLQVFDAEIDARAADNAMLGAIAEEGIRYFTGLDEARPLVVGTLDEKAAPPELDTLQSHLALARLNRAELALLERAVRARELQAKLERANFLPNIVVAAEFGFGWSTQDLALRSVCRVPSPDAACVDTADLYARPYENPLDFLTLGIGLGMRWELDFFQQYGQYQTVLAQNEEVLAQRRRAIGAIELEIKKLWLEAARALEKVRITERRLDAARRWRDQFGLTMQTGGGALEDAVEPLKAFFEARALHLQARYDYQVARAALAQGVGVRDLAPPVNQSRPSSSDE